MKNRIKELRKNKGYTLEKLASLVNLSIPHVSKIENHQRGLEVSWLEPFGKALGVRPIDILVGDWNTDSIIGRPAIQECKDVAVVNQLTDYDKDMLEEFKKLDRKQQISLIYKLQKNDLNLD